MEEDTQAQLILIQKSIRAGKYAKSLFDLINLTIDTGTADITVLNLIREHLKLDIEKSITECNFKAKKNYDTPKSIKTLKRVPLLYSDAIERLRTEKISKTEDYHLKYLGIVDRMQQSFSEAMQDLFRRKDLIKIEDILSFLFKRGFKSERSLLLLAQLYSLKEDYLMTHSCYKELLKTDNSFKTRLKYCQSLVDLGNAGTALSFLDTNFSEHELKDYRCCYLKAKCFYDTYLLKKARVTLEAFPGSLNEYEELANLYCVILNDLGETKEAANFLFSIIEKGTSSPHIINNCAVMFSYIDKTEKAQKLFKATIKRNPNNIEAYYNLSNLTLKEINVDALMKLHRSYKNLKKQDRAQLDLTTFKIMEYQRKYELAFKYLDRANKSIKAALGNDILQNEKKINLIKNLAEHIVAPRKLSADIRSKDFRPIFVVGMPRSGTTLLTQILSAHFNIESLGELPYLNYLLTKNVLVKESLTRDELSSIREAYLVNAMNHRKTDAKFFIDKMPLNFIWMDWIELLFPDAQIIHLTRNPKDLFWSNFKTYFSGKGNSFTYDFNDIVKYYEFSLESLIDRRLNCKNFISTSLEAIQSNYQLEAEKILYNLDLKWTPEMEIFYKSKSAVRTASSRQVRRPVYKVVEQAWLPYKKYLPKIFFEY